MLFIGKSGDFCSTQAAEKVRENIPDATIILAARGDSWPPELETWSGDYLISYLSPFIIPKTLLERTRVAALNFHPGPPEYPGIGCTNFAVYNEETVYGITCHHIAPKVDTGAIVEVQRFSVLNTDTVHSVTQRCYRYIWDLFNDIFLRILNDDPLPESDEHWQRVPYRRSELQELCRVTLDMSVDEVARRVKATHYPGAPGAYIDFHGFQFEYSSKCEEPVDRDTDK